MSSTNEHYQNVLFIVQSAQQMATEGYNDRSALMGMLVASYNQAFQMANERVWDAHDIVNWLIDQEQKNIEWWNQTSESQHHARQYILPSSVDVSRFDPNTFILELGVTLVSSFVPRSAGPRFPVPNGGISGSEIPTIPVADLTGSNAERPSDHFALMNHAVNNAGFKETFQSHSGGNKSASQAGQSISIPSPGPGPSTNTFTAHVQNPAITANMEGLLRPQILEHWDSPNLQTQEAPTAWSPYPQIGQKTAKQPRAAGNGKQRTPHEPKNDLADYHRPRKGQKMNDETNKLRDAPDKNIRFPPGNITAAEILAFLPQWHKSWDVIDRFFSNGAFNSTIADMINYSRVQARGNVYNNAILRNIQPGIARRAKTEGPGSRWENWRASAHVAPAGWDPTNISVRGFRTPFETGGRRTPWTPGSPQFTIPFKDLANGVKSMPTGDDALDLTRMVEYHVAHPDLTFRFPEAWDQLLQIVGGPRPVQDGHLDAAVFGRYVNRWTATANETKKKKMQAEEETEA